MRFRGVILDLDEKGAMLINDEGLYLKIRKTQQMLIGAYVEYEQTDVLSDTEHKHQVNINGYRKYIYAVGSLAAVVAIVFSVLFLMNSNMANSTFAYIDVDINPSIELKVNQNGFITGVEPLNKEAGTITEDVDFMGLEAENGVLAVIDKASEMGYLQSENKFVLVAASINVNEKISEDKYQKMNSQLTNLIDRIDTTVDLKYKDIQLIAFNTSPGKMKLARENHMSIGRYSLYKNACNEGIKLALDDAKKLKISELLNLLPSKDYTEFEEQEKKSAIDDEFIKNNSNASSDKGQVATDNGSGNKSRVTSDNGNITDKNQSATNKGSSNDKDLIVNDNGNIKDNNQNQSEKEVNKSDFNEKTSAAPTPVIDTPVSNDHDKQNTNNNEGNSKKESGSSNPGYPLNKASVEPSATPSVVTPTAVEIISPSHGNNGNGKGNSVQPTQAVQQTPAPGVSSPMPSSNSNPGNKPAVTPPGLIKKETVTQAPSATHEEKGNGKAKGSKNQN